MEAQPENGILGGKKSEPMLTRGKVALTASWAGWTAMVCAVVAGRWSINRDAGIAATKLGVLFVLTLASVHLAGYQLYKHQENARRYTSAFKSAILQQVVVGVLAGLTLDMGEAIRAATIGMAAYWLGTGVIVVRRPSEPTALDILWVKYGFVAVFLTIIGLIYALSTYRS